MADRDSDMAGEIVTPLTRDEVIAKLRVSKEWFDRHVASLRRDQGFPRPAIGRLYDPRAIAAWQTRRLEANGVRHEINEARDAGCRAYLAERGLVANDDEEAEIRAAQAAMDRNAIGR